ncbi:MAG: ATP-binding cassette domain-containing protein [Bdellovibrionota bacterium]
MSYIENLTKDYGDFLLKVQRLELDAKGLTALMGPSGSGKTSLFRILLGLEKADRGRWMFNDEDMLQKPIQKRQLGAVFQSYELFPHLSAQDNILFAAQARGIARDKAQSNLKRLTDSLKLQSCLNRKAEVLSGGEKQRVAIARALIGEPVFLLMDEPFAALDIDLRKEARALVKETLNEWKVPALIITHDQEDVAALGARLTNI